MANEEIREYAKQRGIPLWKVAQKLGISEPTITRLLRVDLSPDEKHRIIDIIDKLERETA